MVNVLELQGLIKQAVINVVNGLYIVGRTGRFEDFENDTFQSDPRVYDSAGNLIPNRIWCRINGAIDATPVWNTNVNDQKTNIPVWLEKMPDGEYRVVDVYHSEASPQYEEALTALLNPAPQPDLVTDLVNVRRIRQIRASANGGLTMAVSEGFVSGQYFAGGTIALATPNAADTQYLAQVGIRTSDLTLVVTYTPAVATGSPLTASNVNSTLFALNVEPIAAVPLASGATTFSNENIIDIRSLITRTAAGDGEANTALNAGVGAAVFKEKSGVQLLFRSILSSDNSVTVTENTEEIDLTVDDTALTDHIADTSAHGVTSAIVGTTDTATLQNKTLDDTNTIAAGALPQLNGDLIATITADGTSAVLEVTNIPQTYTNLRIECAFASDDTSVRFVSMNCRPNADGDANNYFGVTSTIGVGDTINARVAPDIFRDVEIIASGTGTFNITTGFTIIIRNYRGGVNMRSISWFGGGLYSTTAAKNFTGNYAYRGADITTMRFAIVGAASSFTADSKIVVFGY